MKFTANTRELQNKLTAVSKVIQNKSTLAILGYAMLSQRDGKFYLTGSSSDNQLTVPVDILLHSKEAFTPFCINVTEFLNLLSTLSDQPVEIEVQDKIFATTVKYAGGYFSFVCQSAADYPFMPTVAEPEVEFTIPSGVLLLSVKAAAGCTKDNELRPVMSSVVLDADNEGVTIVATDGHKLYRNIYHHGVPFLAAGSPFQVLLPGNLVSALVVPFAKAENVVVRADAKRVEIQSDDAFLSARTIEGKYPNYNTVIPKDLPYHVTAPVRDLAQISKRMSLMANTSSGLCIIERKGDMVYFRSQDVEFSRAAQCEAPVIDNNLPEGFRIGIKIELFAQLLGNITTDNVTLLLADPSKPILLKEDATNSSLTELLMPMKIS